MKYVTSATIFLIILAQISLIFGKIFGWITVSWLVVLLPILVIGAVDFCLVIALIISGHFTINKIITEAEATLDDDDDE